MSMIAPLGPVYQAGTLSGNPFAMAAGLAQLKMISIPHTYDQLEQRTNRLAQGMQEIAKETKHDVQISSVTGMLSIFFCKDEVTDFESAKNCDTEKFAKFWQGLKKRGIYWPPSQFEAAFVSLIHSKLELDETLQAISEALKEI
jgi:glutamate-1-semialdehyde 2,1-aminomutase